MKFVRLTNQRQASSSSARSIHHGSIGTTRNSAGRLASMMTTASACSSSRGATSMVQMSSTAADQRDERRGREHQPQRVRIRRGLMQPDRGGDRGDGDGRGDDRDAAALRRRLAMRRARVGMRQRIALQHGSNARMMPALIAAASATIKTEFNAVHH